MTLIVVGLDLSLTATGMAINYGGLVETGRVRTTGKKDDDLVARQSRLSGICNTVLSFVMGDDEFPDLVVVESPSYGSVHGSAHDRSGLWWLVVDALRELDLPIATVSPTGRAKYGTGNGRSQKKAVLDAARITYPDIELVDDNVADAVLLMAMGMRWLGHPIEPKPLLLKQIEAVDGAAWPT